MRWRDAKGKGCLKELSPSLYLTPARKHQHVLKDILNYITPISLTLHTEWCTCASSVRVTVFPFFLLYIYVFRITWVHGWTPAITAGIGDNSDARCLTTFMLWLVKKSVPKQTSPIYVKRPFFDLRHTYKVLFICLVYMSRPFLVHTSSIVLKRDENRGLDIRIGIGHDISRV